MKTIALSLLVLVSSFCSSPTAPSLSHDAHVFCYQGRTIVANTDIHGNLNTTPENIEWSWIDTHTGKWVTVDGTCILTDV